jgi:hypothetical protein
MTHICPTRSVTAWLCLAAIALLAQGCAPSAPAWNGIFAVDTTGGAKTCSAPSAAPPAGQSVLAQVRMSNDGWCGINASQSNGPYASYLMITRPGHGRVFAHRVGDHTRIDYTPDRGYAGTDSFAVRMIPGDAVIEGAVTVTR